MRPQVRAALFLGGAMLSFSAMGMLVKWAGQEIPAVEQVFFRGLVGMTILGILAWRRGVDLRGRNRRLLLLRGVAGTTALILFFHAVTRIPVAEAILLNQATPIFVLPLAAWLLEERIGWRHGLWAAVALAGVTIVLRPGLEEFNLPGLAALVSALFAAVAYVTVRRLAGSESSLTIVFWFTAISTLVSGPAMLPWFTRPSPRMLAALVVMGVLATTGQLLLTVAYRHGEAGRLSVLGSLGALFGAGWDLVLWGHLPDGWTALGGGLAIVACAALQRHGPARPQPRIA
jgi:drug/metabolite transporter (DMT)-like permease